MPRDTNPVVVITDSTQNVGQDVSGNPTTGSGLTGSGHNVGTTPTSNAPAQETGNTNPTPMLITPEVEPPHRPVGSGSSVIVEPEIGTPIVREEPTQMIVSGIQPAPQDEKPNNSVKNLVNSLPSFLGGGGGGASAEESTDPNAPKKPNYVLYGGILLAVIVLYKVFSKKKKK